MPAAPVDDEEEAIDVCDVRRGLGANCQLGYKCVEAKSCLALESGL